MAHFFLFYLTIFRLLSYVHSQCTTTDSDTCYIDRNKVWTPLDSNIQCDGSLKRCIIFCSGSNLSCSSGDSPWNVYIICPVDADLCILNCESDESCKGSIVLATTSKETQINIGGSNAGKGMTVYAPGWNGGTLSVRLMNSKSDFYESTIKAQQNSSSILINCEQGNLCNKNIIEGNRASSVNLLCDGLNSADCSNSNIYCPDTTQESLLCNLNCANCRNSNVYATNALEWKCENTETSCVGSNVFCGSSHSQLSYQKSEWIYVPNIDNQCMVNNDKNKATMAPTKTPTSAPTLAPTHTQPPNKNSNTRSVVIVETKSILEISESNTSKALKPFDPFDPLYALIFVLTITLCCVVSILLCWMYNQSKMDSQRIPKMSIDHINADFRSPRDCRKYTFSPSPRQSTSNTHTEEETKEDVYNSNSSPFFNPNHQNFDVHKVQMDVIDDVPNAPHLPQIPILTPRTNKNDSPSRSRSMRGLNTPITISVMQTPSSNHQHHGFKTHKSKSPTPNANALQVPFGQQKRAKSPSPKSKSFHNNEHEQHKYNKNERKKCKEDEERESENESISAPESTDFEIETIKLSQTNGVNNRPHKGSLNEIKKQKFALPAAYRPKKKMFVTMNGGNEEITLECTKIVTNGRKYKNYHIPPSMAYNLKKKSSKKQRFEPPSTEVTATSCSSSTSSHTEETECKYTDCEENETEYYTNTEATTTCNGYKESETLIQSASSSDATEESSSSESRTYSDEEEGTMSGNRRLSKTMNTRITNDGMKEVSIGIKSDVLEADIVKHLYDRSVKPLKKADSYKE